MAMSTDEQMPLAEVKDHLSEVVERVAREHGRVVVTKHGKPAAVLLSVGDLVSLEETLDVMADSALLGDIRESLTELESRAAQPLSREQALNLIADR